MLPLLALASVAATSSADSPDATARMHKGSGRSKQLLSSMLSSPRLTRLCDPALDDNHRRCMVTHGCRDEYRSDFDAGRGGWGKAIENVDAAGELTAPRRMSMPPAVGSGSAAPTAAGEAEDRGRAEEEPSAKRSRQEEVVGAALHPHVGEHVG